MQLLWNMLLLCSLAILSHNVAFARPAARKYAAEGICRDNGRSEATNDGDLSPEETSSTYYEYEEPVQTWPQVSPLEPGKFSIKIDLEIIVDFEETPAGLQVNVIRKNVEGLISPLHRGKFRIQTDLGINVMLDLPIGLQVDVGRKNVEGLISPLGPGEFRIEIDFEITIEKNPACLQVNVIRKNVEGLRSPLDLRQFKIKITIRINVIIEDNPLDLQVTVVRSEANVDSKKVEGLMSYKCLKLAIHGLNIGQLADI